MFIPSSNHPESLLKSIRDFFKKKFSSNQTNPSFGFCYIDVFGSMVAGAFQITFRAKMYANDVFLFFKNHF
jgi:hypothetical protein